jgi:hypothetical protein
VAGFALLGAAWARADSIPIPGHFTINLNDLGQTDKGGWGANNFFSDTVSTVVGHPGFKRGSFNHCHGEVEEEVGCDDPYISINKGGHSRPFGHTFHADQNGGGILDFLDVGPPITDILITTNFIFGDTVDTYVCDSDIFMFCGFKNDNGKLEILFTSGTIPTATPEPSQGILLLIFFGALLVVHRIRSRKVSA